MHAHDFRERVLVEVGRRTVETIRRYLCADKGYAAAPAGARGG